MRIYTTLFSVLLAFAVSTGAQSEDDPYSINLVRVALNSHSQGALISVVAKNIPRGGDRVTIALIKIFDKSELSNPRTVSTFLPIIRQSFSQPQFISVDADKKPAVTIMFLEYLQRSVSSAKTRKDIEETIKYVKEKTTAN